MPLSKLWVIAYRDLFRHRRRSVFTLMAVALGLALLFVMNGLISGMMAESLQNSIRLRTAHLQLRAASYQEDQMGLQSRDLLADPAGLVAQASTLSQVQAAAPVLWVGGILNTIDESAGLLPVVGAHELEERSTGEARQFRAQEFCGRRVGVRDAVQRVDAEDDVVGTLDE